MNLFHWHLDGNSFIGYGVTINMVTGGWTVDQEPEIHDNLQVLMDSIRCSSNIDITIRFEDQVHTLDSTALDELAHQTVSIYRKEKFVCHAAISDVFDTLIFASLDNNAVAEHLCDFLDAYFEGPWR